MNAPATQNTGMGHGATRAGRIAAVPPAASPPAGAGDGTADGSVTRSGWPAPHGVGPWGGRRLLYRGDEALESLTNGELHVVLLDLLVSIARSRADLAGRSLDRIGGRARAAKVDAMAAEKSVVVARTAVMVAKALKAMAAAVPPIPVTFADVAEWLEDKGAGVHRSTLYRRPEYANPILLAMGRKPRDSTTMEAVADPEYARVAHLTKPELVEEIRRAGKALKAAERELADMLAGLTAL